MSFEIGQIVYVTNPTRDLVCPAFVAEVDGLIHTVLFYNGATARLSADFLGVWPMLTADLFDFSIRPCQANFFSNDPSLATTAASRSLETSSSTDFETVVDAVPPSEVADQTPPTTPELPPRLQLSESLIENTLERRPSTLRRLKQKTKKRLPVKKAPAGQPVKVQRRQTTPHCCSIQ